MEAKQVLIIDDEKSFLLQFQSFLKNKGIPALTAQGAEAALDLLKEEKVAAVLCDERMPGTRGHELLAQLQKDYPQIVRCLITGYSDLDAVVDAVNQGAIFQYIAKSDAPEKIYLAVRHCLDKYHEDQAKEKLLQAKKKLLGQIAAQQNLSLLGIFGQNLAEKIENTALRLCHHLFEKAGRQDEEAAIKEIQILEQSLGKIRKLAQLSEKAKAESSLEPRTVITQEIERLKSQINPQDYPYRITTHLSEDPKALRFQGDDFPRLLKELLENALLFSPAEQREIEVYSQWKNQDQSWELKILNPTHLVEGQSLGQFLAPFYTSLHPEPWEQGFSQKDEDYQLKQAAHYGLGLSLAQALAYRNGASLTLSLEGKCFQVSLTMEVA